MTQLERHQHVPTCCPGPHRDLDLWTACPPRQPVWCPQCATDILSRIRGLPDDAVRLRDRSDGRVMTGSPAERRAEGVASGSPSPAWDLTDQVMRWVRQVEAVLGEQVGVPPAA